MNAGRLLEVYEQISEAPDAIALLRRFVLDLAVRGKLVEQDVADEPASALLDRMIAERAELERSKAIKKVKLSAFEPYDGSIPANWVWTQLGIVGDWGSGSTPQRGNPEFYGGGISWLKSGELGDTLELKGSEETVTKTALAKCSFRLNKPGDVLIAMYGATIGKLAILAENAVTNQAVCGCTPFSGLANRYLFLFLLANREAFHASSEGGAQPNISKVKIVNTPFPLPPLAEQHRIVAKVDELMALCDRLEEARKTREEVRDKLTAASLARLTAPDTAAQAEPAKVDTGFASGSATSEDDFPTHAAFALEALPALTTRPDQIKTLRQTILNLAVRGKLVDQDAADEKSSQIEPYLPDSIGRPFEIPNSWQWARLRSLGVMKGGGTPSKSHDNFWNGEIPWVSPKDMKVDYISRAQLSITEEAISGSSVNLLPPESVLFVVRGMILAHSFPVAISRVPLTINQDMKAIVLKDPRQSDYILRALWGMKPEMLERVQRSSHGTCRIEGKDYSEFLLPLPPLAEQHRIVAKVDALMALCDRLEAALTTTDTTRTRLLEALLHEALEPATEVLEAAE